MLSSLFVLTRGGVLSSLFTLVGGGLLVSRLLRGGEVGEREREGEDLGLRPRRRGAGERAGDGLRV